MNLTVSETYELKKKLHYKTYFQVEINFIILLNKCDNAQECIDFLFFALQNLFFYSRTVHLSFNICTIRLHRPSIDLLIVLNIRQYMFL